MAQYERGILSFNEVAAKIQYACHQSMEAHREELRAAGCDVPRDVQNAYGDVVAEAWSWHFEEWLQGLMPTLVDPEIRERLERGLGRGPERASEYAADVHAFERLCERASGGDDAALAEARSIVAGAKHAWLAQSLVDHDAYAVALAAFPVDWPGDRLWHPCGWPRHVVSHRYPFVVPLLQWLADAARAGDDEVYHHLLEILEREQLGLFVLVIDLLPLRDRARELEILRRRIDQGILGHGSMSQQRLDAAIERLETSELPTI